MNNPDINKVSKALAIKRDCENVLGNVKYSLDNNQMDIAYQQIQDLKELSVELASLLREISKCI